MGFVEYPATDKQIKYLEILFADTGFTIKQRNAYCTEKCKRRITFLDELKRHEASDIISELKEIKENKRSREEIQPEEDEF